MRRDTSRPMLVGGRLVVRIRRERHPFGPFSLVLWRLTHPLGRRRLAGTAGYYTPDAAATAAREHGWHVLRPS